MNWIKDRLDNIVLFLVAILVAQSFALLYYAGRGIPRQQPAVVEEQEIVPPKEAVSKNPKAKVVAVKREKQSDGSEIVTTTRQHIETVEVPADVVDDSTGVVSTEAGKMTDAVADPVCVKRIMSRLQKASPHAYRIYQQLKSKEAFLNFLGSCAPEEVIQVIRTAAHEAVHALVYTNANSAAYYYLDGKYRQHGLKLDNSPLPPPSVLVKAYKYPVTDFDVTEYLGTQPGAAASAQSFMRLLDELSAYTHDLQIAWELVRDPVWGKTNKPPRKTFIMFMLFVADYVSYVQRTGSMAAKEELVAGKEALTALIRDAMVVHGRTNNFVVDPDEDFTAKALCQPNRTKALGQLVGMQINLCRPA